MQAVVAHEMLTKPVRCGVGVIVENALIKVPLESLTRYVQHGAAPQRAQPGPDDWCSCRRSTVRVTVPHGDGRNVKNEQKQVAKEIDAVTSKLAELRRRQVSTQQASGEIATLVTRLQGLKRKLDSWHQDAEADLERTARRVEHLCGYHDASPAQRSSKRIDRCEQIARATFVVGIACSRVDNCRLVADQLGRNGLLTTAKRLVEEGELEALVDMHPVQQAAPIISAVHQGELNPAIKWCGANRTRLKRNKCNLEMEVRLQGLTEILRKDGVREAIVYARSFLAPLASAPGPMQQENLAALKRHMGLLAFGKDTEVEPYRSLMDIGRRQELADKIEAEILRAASLPLQSPLSVAFEAGLTCLKTTHCLQQTDQGSKCPVCHASFSRVAEMLPSVNRRNSSLVCRSCLLPGSLLTHLPPSLTHSFTPPRLDHPRFLLSLSHTR